jgi:hypothetical protein
MPVRPSSGGDDYWYQRYQDTETRRQNVTEAACLAVGAAGYLLSEDCRATPVQRLAHLARVVAELRVVLGLPTETDLTTTTAAAAARADATDPREGETR